VTTKRGLATALVLLLLSTVDVAALGKRDEEGDSRIGEAARRGRQAEERAKERRRRDEERPAAADGEKRAQPALPQGPVCRDDGDCGGYLESLRFAPYPYSPDTPFFYNASALQFPLQEKQLSLRLSSSLADHLDGTWGSSTRAVAQLSALHANLYRLTILGKYEDLSVLSANVGVTAYLPGFMLSGFLGGYSMDVTEYAYLSFGFDCQLFLPGHLHVDVFDVNSLFGDSLFSHVEACVEVSLWRFSLGAGWHHNSFAGVVFSGPALQASFWL
jgi:hypothetical protein